MSMVRRVPVLVLIVVAMMLPGVSGAQPAREGVPGPGPEVAPATAPVRLDGSTLFRVRGVTAYPADVRAKAIAGRIRALAADRSFSPEKLRVVESPDSSQILAGDRLVAAVVDADARVEGVERPVLAQVYMVKIADAIRSFRRDRAPNVLLRNALYTVLATALLAFVLLLLRWGFRRSDALAERIMKARLEGLEAASRSFLRAEHLWGAVRQALRAVYLLIVLAAAFQYLQFVLSRFPWTRGFAEGMATLVLDPLDVMGRAFVASIPDLVFLAILAFVTRILLRSIRRFFDAVGQGTITVFGFQAEWALPTFKILRLVIIAFAVVVAYPYIPGSSSAAFKGISLFLGVIMSFGATSIVANILAGYTLIYRRAFRLGDRIQVDGHMGDVVEIRNMVTHMRTPKNEEVVLPNSTILNSHVVNYSALAKNQGLILHTTVGIGYETPWRQVEAMLLMAAERTPGLLREPSPFVLASSLGDFAVTYELNAHCNDPSAMLALYSGLHKNILDVFNEYGVQIMTPAYRADTEPPKIVPREQWFSPPAVRPSPE